MSGFYENISTEVSVEADVADAEAAKTAAEAAQTAAESARDTALQHKNAAEVAKNAAETAETNAESAESTATTAKSSAEAARDLAETYKNAAETAKTAAETAETNATNTVASVSSDVATVAAIDSEITSVAGSLSSVNTVAGDLSGSNNIGTVAGIDTEIGTVAGISSDVTAVAGDATDIGTVATDLAGSDTIGTVSSNIANVNTVAGISSDITAVAGDAADIGTVASNLTGDNTIGSVSSSISNVNTVANNMADVNSVADNMTDVSNAATNAGNAASSATAAAASATSASTSATNAASSESAASTSASSAASNAASASTSATQASTSATQASSSADLASSSATAAASSATAAATSESNAEDSQQAAAASESNASGSASSALSSATSATSSASSAASSASSAAASAASASNIIADLVDLDSAVSNASSSASSASTSASQAQSYRDEAETHKDNAYTYSQSAASAVAYQDLTAIAESKSVTAVDVFVYDTTKDSDGGAWRDQTQHTSWYNETLNTSTRGATKKFPAVAVVVVESNKVTIYDGDDPSMPMWMVFNGGSGVGVFFSGDALTSVSFLNGTLVFGSSSPTGFKIVNFVSEVILGHRYGSNNTYTGKFLGLISQRNTATYDGIVLPQTIRDEAINDVAMTVLPDAPIDDATGLPTPTIAVATEDGVSIIKDDGTVVDIRNGDNVNDAQSVAFTSDNKIACQLYDQRRGIRIFDIPDADVTQGNHYIKSNALEWYEGFSNEGSTQDGDLDIDTASAGNTAANTGHSLNAIDINKTLYLSKPNGLAAVHRNPSSPSSGAVASVASDHTTGWMVGDIKGAFLSDTDSTNLAGSELVDNGDFATTSDWSLQSGVSISGGVLSSDGTSTGELARQSDIGVANGSIYAISFDVISLTAGKFGVKLGGTTPVYFDTTGSHEAHFVATATDNVQIMGLSGTTGSVDNVSVKPAVPDRSFNKNGLTVNGTITRSAVATGAELVGYSGFSASNYLEQPYNSDLDFGTGDFCITVWAKQNGTSTRYIVDTRNNAGAGVFLVAGSSYQLALNAGNSVTGGTAGTGNWTHVTGLRRSGTLELYVNGELVSSTANTYAASNPSGRLTVGVRGGLLTGPYLGSLALLRISATAPSAEQIKKIYNDERHLFKENANCTLYGTSDDVNALAYDEDTGLLHVGTSGGRSVFKGLQRVDNTTDAVGVAISASNDLVVEE